MRAGFGARALLALSLAAVRAHSPAHAAGFALFEQGSAAMGRAGAFVAGPSDASALFYNPAALAGLRGTQLLLSPSLILFDDSFGRSAPYPGYGPAERTDRKAFPLPAFYLSRALSGRVTAAAGLTLPFGLETDWTRNTRFSGRFLASRSRLEQLDAGAGLGVEASGALRLGAALDLTMSTILLQRAIALPSPGADTVLEVGGVTMESAHETALGGTFGAQWRAGSHLSLGLTLRTGTSAEFALPAHFSYTGFTTGNATEDSLIRTLLPEDQGAHTRIRFPMMLLGGVEWRLSGRLSAELDANWTRWSTFDTLALRFSKNVELSQNLVQAFHNAAAVRAGVEYRSMHWTLRGGGYWDGTPQPAETMSPLLSDTSRLGLSVGAGRSLGPLRADAYALLVIFHDRSTGGSSVNHYDGSYRPRAGVLGLSLGWVP